MDKKEILEKCFEDYPSIVTIEKTKIILNQLENSICKIYINEGGHGTGFLCYIENKIGKDKNKYKSKEKMPVLITNNHIIGEKQIIENQILKVSFNNDKIWEDLSLDRKKKKIYTSKKYDITIIEIKKKEINTNSFLEIDDRLYEEGSENIFRQKGAYIIQYPNDYPASVSYGIIKNFSESYKLTHYCHTKDGSSGSPILNLENNKVIGVHYGSKEKGNYNNGFFLYAPIKEFFNNYSDDIDFDLNKNPSINFTKINNNFKNSTYEESPKLSQSLVTKNVNNIINKNEIKITLEIKSNEAKKEVYFLCNNKESKKLPSYLCELNPENTELFIEGGKREYQNYFIPPKKGIYEIILKFKNHFKKCCYMFSSCKQITKIDLSNFKTKEVTDMSYMFYFCSNLKEVNLSNLSTENVINMSNMFSNCSKLSLIDTSSFNIKNVNNMKQMFLNCRNLKNIDFSSSIACYNLDNTQIFEGCWNFEKIKLNINSKEKFKEEIKKLKEQLIKKDLNIEYV